MRAAPLSSLRLHSLDVLRGLAALAVVVTHWPDLLIQGTTGLGIPRERLPFFEWLWPLYDQGWRAVDFFFCLSGFIFHCLYSERIADRLVHAREFALLRFSRLYPLHFVTLLGVGLMQWYLLRAQGSFQVVPTNDLNHFVQHLFFASSWGWGHVSFNGPVWSVSVEVVLYAIFFAACFAGWRRWWQVGALALAGFALEFHNRFTAIGRGMTGFFIGALVAIVFLHWRESRSRVPVWALGVAAVVAWGAALAEQHFDLFRHAAAAWPGVTIRGYTLSHIANHFAFRLLAFQLFAAPWTILALACLEEKRPGCGRRLGFLGEISYSSYLLHVPLQLVCAVIFLRFGIDRSIANSPLFFIGFFAVLIALSLLSFHGFERPLQRYLRDRFLPRPSPLPAVSPGRAEPASRP